MSFGIPLPVTPLLWLYYHSPSSRNSGSQASPDAVAADRQLGILPGALSAQIAGDDVVPFAADDGASRAAQAIMAALIARLLPLDAAERAALSPHLAPVLRNWNGIEVGQIRVTEAI